MLPEIFPLIAGSAAVTSIIGTNPTRFYPHGQASQNTPAPYASWFVVSGVPENCMDEVPRVDRFSIQIDCWSDNTGDGADQANDLATAIRDTLEPYAHMTAIVVDGVDPDTKRNRIALQFTFWTDRDLHS